MHTITAFLNCAGHVSARPQGPLCALPRGSKWRARSSAPGVAQVSLAGCTGHRQAGGTMPTSKWFHGASGLSNVYLPGCLPADYSHPLSRACSCYVMTQCE